MDTLKLIQQELLKIKKKEYYDDFLLIINHIVRAEKYFETAIQTDDNEYYNDVIYRTNQAYEGALRIAYNIFITNNKNKTTYEIENILNKENIFNERVKNMFSIYRNEWRNESIHKFDILFNKSEAIMAINTVSSFIYLLLEQIIQKDIYDIISTNINELNNISDLNEFTIKLLLLFSNMIYNDKENDVITCQSIIKKLIELISKKFKNIKIIENNHALDKGFDLTLKKDKEEVDIEIKIISNPFGIKNHISYAQKIKQELNRKKIILFEYSGEGNYESRVFNHDKEITLITKKFEEV